MISNVEAKIGGICVVLISVIPEKLLIPVSRLLEILEPTSDRVYLIVNKMPDFGMRTKKLQIIDLGSRLEYREAIKPKLLQTFIWLLRLILVQIKAARAMFRISRDTEIFIFSNGAGYVTVPLLPLIKILRKKSILPTGGRSSKGFLAIRPQAKLSFRLQQIIEDISFYLADCIAVDSENSVDFLGLRKFINKVSIVRFLAYIDTDYLVIKNKIEEKGDLVGYIGNLARNKGVWEFVEAIPLLLEENSNIDYLIGGDGPLLAAIRDKIEKDSLQHKVRLTGWISHDNELCDYLNQLKLLVLPSYSEGLPGIILEAMACGTPVLATPVGAIPDIIKDGETGFILENNSPECVARNILRALEHPDLNQIARNARTLIEQRYTYETMVKRYREILGKI